MKNCSVSNNKIRQGKPEHYYKNQKNYKKYWKKQNLCQGKKIWQIQDSLRKLRTYWNWLGLGSYKNCRKGLKKYKHQNFMIQSSLKSGNCNKNWTSSKKIKENKSITLEKDKIKVYEFLEE